MAADLPKALRLSFRPKRGPINEEPVSSQQFLASFLEYGVWLRALAAYTHLQHMEMSKEDKLERLAANMAFYQQVGLAVEDIYSNLIVWSIWSQDKSQRLPDLMERLMLRFGRPQEEIGARYADEIRAKAKTSTKKVSIYPAEYLVSLVSLYKGDIVKQFGIPWKHNPSVKLVPRNMLDKWNIFPSQLLVALDFLTQPRNIDLTYAHNKLKHGPQIVVSSPLDSCIARGLAPEDIRDAPIPNPILLNKDLIRMLLHGARTQEESDVDDFGAPFLTDNLGDARDFFNHVVFHYANILFFMGTWIYNSAYPDAKREHRANHAIIRRLTDEQSTHLRR